MDGEPQPSGGREAEAASNTGEAAAQLLWHAQRVADELRSQAQQDLDDAAARSRAMDAEVLRLHHEAAADRATAARTVRAAQDRLAAASQEAQQLVADAADQGTLLMQAAETQRHEILTEAEATTAERLAAATRAVDEARQEADRLRAEARREAESLLADASRRGKEQDAASAELVERRRREAELAAQQLLTRAEEEAVATLAEAREAANELRQSADRAVAALRDDAERVHAESVARADDLTRGAREEAELVLAAAAEQTDWTQQTMDSLLATAELEARRVRAAASADAARHVQRLRLRLQDVIARLAARLRDEIQEADDHAVELGEVATHVLAAAHADAERVLAAAGAAAERVKTDGADHAAMLQEQAQRRLDEAETGARILRERVADEVTRNQRAAQDELRQARTRAAEQVADARGEADALRAQARAMLEDARQEVTVLTRRRNEIAAELTGLSGVISALAVPGDGTMPPQRADGPAEPEPTDSEEEVDSYR